MATKKVGSTGRYGPRYGTKAKKRIAVVEKEQKKKHACPYCERSALKRLAAGIWLCRKCNKKFAGAAYFPTSPVGEAASAAAQLASQALKEIGPKEIKPKEIKPKTEKGE